MLSSLLDKLESSFPHKFDGKTAIEILKENDYNWKQMEWAGFYTEFLINNILQFNADMAWGNRFGSTVFDAKLGDIDLDYKTHSTNTNSNWLMCNDWTATEKTIEQNGKLYILVVNVNFDYDQTGDFKVWHDILKGKKSKYCRTGNRRSRKRKVSGVVESICIYEINKETLDDTSICKQIKQGKNSNGKKRPLKMSLNLEKAEPIHKLIFA